MTEYSRLKFSAEMCGFNMKQVVYQTNVIYDVADTLWSVHTRHETPICQESTMQNNILSL